MVGILSYGADMPLCRLSTGPRSEKAVANRDEDSLTMAVAETHDCLGGIDRKTVGGLERDGSISRVRYLFQGYVALAAP